MNQLSNYPWLNWYVSNLKSIPGGAYRYGASPSRSILGTAITMSPFRMGATPVTWGMWKEYCKSKSVRMPSEPKWGYLDNHPVVNASWNDIVGSGGFCEWASGVAGFNLTLPTEEQWEYAARGGKDGLEYPWGNDFDGSRLWCNAQGTAPVDRTGIIYRNGYGLTDMVGNVWEWCFDKNIQEFNSSTGNYFPFFLRLRWGRGGSWNVSSTEFFECSFSWLHHPFMLRLYDDGSGDGFRLSAGQK